MLTLKSLTHLSLFVSVLLALFLAITACGGAVPTSEIAEVEAQEAVQGYGAQLAEILRCG